MFWKQGTFLPLKSGSLKWTRWFIVTVNRHIFKVLSDYTKSGSNDLKILMVILFLLMTCAECWNKHMANDVLLLNQQYSVFQLWKEKSISNLLSSSVKIIKI